MKEEIQLFFSGNFVTYFEVDENITQDDIVNMAMEHLPKDFKIERIKVKFVPHKFLSINKIV